MEQARFCILCLKDTFILYHLTSVYQSNIVFYSIINYINVV